MKKFALFISVTSFTIMGISLVSGIINGLPLGITFTGGISVEFSYETPINIERIQEALNPIVQNANVIEKERGQYRVIFQDQGISDIQERVTRALQGVSQVSIEQFTMIGSHLSSETGVKALVALLISFGVVTLFVAYAFASISSLLSSWKYGAVALTTLFHDVIVSIGVFSIFGYIYNIQIDLLFVTAMLAIIGYSINDTLVIFDRIRMYVSQNTMLFEESVWKGARTSLRRSFYTSVTTVTPLIVLAYTVPLVQWFAIALIIGIVVGTYSSLLFAPSLLVLWYRHSPERSIEKEESEVEQAERELMERLKNKPIDL